MKGKDKTAPEEWDAKGYDNIDPRVMAYFLNSYWTEWFADHLIVKCDYKPILDACEIGVGSGKFSAMMACLGMKVTCVDFQEEMLTNMKKRFPSLNPTFICDSLPHLKKVPKNSFDFVFNEGVVEHFLKRKDRVECYKTLHSLLRDGGIVCTIVPFETPEPDEHQYKSPEDAVREEIAGGHLLCWAHTMDAEVGKKKKRGYLCLVSKKLDKKKATELKKRVEEERKIKQNA